MTDRDRSLTKLLIANRGEIAVRVAQTARRLGIGTVAVASDADLGSAHVAACDEMVSLGPAPAVDSYLRIDKLVEAATRVGAQAIHPGYGFLSENPEFVSAVEAAGIIFVGPTAETMSAMGSKSTAKDLMEAAGVPTTPGYQGDDQSLERFAAEAESIGYPVVLKATAGGGGRGMRVVHHGDELESALASARREALASFGDDRFLIEKYLQHARHLEVQVFGDGHGEVVHLFERDCSVQRRHQKVIEEAPAPDLSDELRQRLLSAGVQAAKAVDYRGAGTVEFLFDGSDSVYFIEMNTRLQVEHPVTEMITGVDLVEWQLRVAAGEPLPLTQDEIHQRGHAIEARLYAEVPSQGFVPSVGTLTTLQLPFDQARVDSGVTQGQEVSAHYDPMLAKIIAAGPDRSRALARLASALRATRIAGIDTNTEFLGRIAEHRDFAAGAVTTGFVAERMAELADESPSFLLPAEVVAAAVLADAPHDGGADPWGSQSGFRLNGARRQNRWIMSDGSPALVTVRSESPGSASEGALLVTLQGDASAEARRAGRPLPEAIEFQVRVRSDDSELGKLAVEHEGRWQTVFIAPHRRGLRIWSGGQAWDVELPDIFAGSGGAEITSDPNGLAAPMPGVVISHAVAVGDRVHAGDTLVVIEAMKTEHAIKAGTSGRVKAFAFQPGEQVAQGDPLVEFEPDPED